MRTQVDIYLKRASSRIHPYIDTTTHGQVRHWLRTLTLIVATHPRRRRDTSVACRATLLGPDGLTQRGEAADIGIKRTGASVGREDAPPSHPQGGASRGAHAPAIEVRNRFPNVGCSPYAGSSRSAISCTLLPDM